MDAIFFFFYLVMFVKDALEEEVGVVVELGAGVRRNFQPAHKVVLNGRHPNTFRPGKVITHAASQGKEVVPV